MRPNLGSRFQSFVMEEADEDKAKAVNAHTYAFIQNKIASYSDQVVEYSYDPTSESQFAAIIKHEQLKACVSVLEELLGELTTPVEAPTSIQS